MWMPGQVGRDRRSTPKWNVVCGNWSDANQAAV